MSATIDDIEEAIEFVDEWEQVMKAGRVIARRTFSNVNINHDMCIRTKVGIFIQLFSNKYR